MPARIDRPFPRGALFAAVALIGWALVSATLARVEGIETTQVPTAAAVEHRDLRFEDRDDGAVAIFAAEDGRPVDVLGAGTNGFIRGLMRGLARERRAKGIGSEPAFRLTRWADGRLSLEDPETGRWIDLGAFGVTQVEAFARLLSVQGPAS